MIENKKIFVGLLRIYSCITFYLFFIHKFVYNQDASGCWQL